MNEKENWKEIANQAIAEKQVQKVGQEQIHRLLFGDKLSWQAIIYDLINTEQLDPWDIDLVLLSQKFLEKLRELEEANFFVSSKVLLAAALLLRMKSEILLEHHIPALDGILFGRKEEQKHYEQGRIELEDEIPELIARTPLPRFKKVTLGELMQALGHAISTETRRIKRIVIARQHEFETALAIPRRHFNIRDHMQSVYGRLKTQFVQEATKLAFSEFAGRANDERISTFIPLLHLDQQHKVLLEQEGHLEEIWIWSKEHYEREHSAELEQMRKEVETAAKEMSKEEGIADEIEEEPHSILEDKEFEEDFLLS